MSSLIKISLALVISFLGFMSHSFAEDQPSTTTDVQCNFNFEYTSNYKEVSFNSNNEEDGPLEITLNNNSAEAFELYGDRNYRLIFESSSLNSEKQRTYNVYIIDNFSVQILLYKSVTGDVKNFNFNPISNFGTYTITNGLSEISHFDLSCTIN